MPDQTALIECFRDTQSRSRNDERLKAETLRMQAETRLYLDDLTAVIRPVKHEKPQILVAEDSTFSCARKWIKPGTKTAVLNFANAYLPGGSVKKGAMAQEECLCRASNLYESLTLPYLVKHYYKWNQKNTGDMGSDRIIYTPGVTVFKSDDDLPQLLPECDWFQTDVITCAAPYYDENKKKPVGMEKLREVFENRIRNILETAIANGVDHLILGAFGCGVFNNPPALVADVFRELLAEQGYAAHFHQVVFAVNGGGENLEAFQKAFESRA